MAFANFSVLAIGGLLMGIPILLHLLMKQRPRHQIFPALRFLNRRQVANKRQLRLRNWLLLALRLAAIGLLAMLFARPTVDSLGLGHWLRTLLLGVLAPLAIAAFAYSWIQKKSNLLVGATGFVSLLLCMALCFFGYKAFTSTKSDHLGDANAPVAAVLVFDTSPRMGLWFQDLEKTRLKEAQEAARELMKQLPADSEVAVVDAASMGTFSVDMGTAVNMVDSLQVMGFEYPLSELVSRGIELVRKRDDKRKEVYVLSDLSENVWQANAFLGVQNQLKENEDISMFVLDVGVERPRNVRLGPVQLSADSLAQGQTLRIDTQLASLDTEGNFDIELSLEEPDPTRPVVVDGKLLLPELIQRRRKTVTLAKDATAPVFFEVRIPAGIHHGQISVKANDGLTIDDRRYFTVEVRPPLPVLLATSKEAEASYVKQAISPDELAQRREAAFDCHVIEASQILNQQLGDYSAIGLLDPDPLTEAHWQRLEEFVARGGGLAIFLGSNAVPAAEFNNFAKKVMPGNLAHQWRVGEGDYLFVSPQNLAHPTLSLFRNNIITWDESHVFKHWTLNELKQGTNVILRYSNNQPAILESVIGDGRVLVMTTPLSDRRNYSERLAWNELPTTEVPLPFFMLVNGIFPYLAGQSQVALNHSVGEVVSIRTQARELQIDGTWQLVTPEGDWQNVRSDQGAVTVSSTESPGTYRLKPGRPDEQGLGFSANLPDMATNVKRLADGKLDEVLGEDQYTLARGTEELNRGIGRARVGRELFPFLALVVVGLLAMEHLMSNRFYPNTSSQTKQRELQTAA